MTSDLLRDLQNWYAKQCDGDWEHNFGISITTCDNPGWWVKINLVGTELQTRSFDPVVERVDDSGFPQGDRWLHCYVEGEVWHGAGDETKLTAILMRFLAWANHESDS